MKSSGSSRAWTSQTLEAAILRQDVPRRRRTRPMPRPGCRRPLTSFVGRVPELDEVRALLERARLVTLVGVGGVGKTRLALEAARRAPPTRRGRCRVRRPRAALGSGPRHAPCRRGRWASAKPLGRSLRSPWPAADDTSCSCSTTASTYEPRPPASRRRCWRRLRPTFGSLPRAARSSTLPARRHIRSAPRSPGIERRSRAVRTSEAVRLLVDRATLTRARPARRRRRVRHGRAHLPRARRPAAGDRAGGGPNEGALARGDRRQAPGSIPVPRVLATTQHRSTSNASRGHGLELRAPGARRAAPPRPPLGVPGRRDAGVRCGGLPRWRRRRGRTPDRAARGCVPPRADRRCEWHAIPAPRDRSSVRRRAPAGGRAGRPEPPACRARAGQSRRRRTLPWREPAPRCPTSWRASSCPRFARRSSGRQQGIPRSGSRLRTLSSGSGSRTTRERGMRVHLPPGRSRPARRPTGGRPSLSRRDPVLRR